MENRRLKVFISSTADLKGMRDAAEKALISLKNIDCSRFEYWPSSPNDPLTECLQRIDESNAFLLILGKRYGSLTQEGISITHREYRHAINMKLPIFAYILDLSFYEKLQNEFIKEINSSHSRGGKIKNKKHLISEISKSFLDEFVISFKAHHSSPPDKLPIAERPKGQISISSLPPTRDETYNKIHTYYQKQQDAQIQGFADQIEEKYIIDKQLMLLVYFAEINLAINGMPFSKERIQRAIELYHKNLESNDAPFEEIYYNLGNAYLALHNIESAIENYKKCIAINKENAQCWKNLAAAYREQKNNELEEDCLKKAIASDPQLFEALYSLATIAIQEKKDYDLGLSYLNKIKIFHLSQMHQAAVYGWMAIASMKKGLLEQAAAMIENSLSANSNQDWGWKNAGRIYSLLRQRDKAWMNRVVKFWIRFIKKYPSVAEAWYEMGFACWYLGVEKKKEGFEAKSLEALIKATELGITGIGLVWDRIGHLYQLQNNWPEAVKAFEKASALNQKDFGYCYAISLKHLGRYSEALPIFMANAKNYRKDHKSWFQVAICYERLGIFIGALFAYRIAIKLHDDYPEAWFSLGGLLWNMKIIDEAKRTWLHAIERYPDDPLAEKAKEFLARLKI